ncbi:type II secretion system protein [Meiothermus sp. QL-1]|uniref:PilW family protein n=1 Tax=Meiothermus sp. QL-1 TaxID=2058095 RepID=UPI000E0BB884|nr:prepilin-type N-terminal cleavage/methylation domain-containing protein [Meiothermus sp. QL-1]RDI95049.1 type II secretion system protein [Meiothermus sp. QL-1]
MRNKGLSLVELLVAMAIFSVVLTLASSLLFNNQNLTSRQVLAGQVHEDVRLATLRLSDIVAQAAYIYPNNVPIILPGGLVVTTGSQALAVLLPPNSAYCPVAGALYCGFVFRVEPRAPFVADLGQTQGNSGFVLAEYQVRGVSWPANTNPAQIAQNWLSLPLHARGVIADSVDPGRTNLGSLYFAGSESSVDRVLAVLGSVSGLTTSSPNALIGAVRVEVAVRYTNGPQAARQAEIYARSIPRSVPPGI